jgi:hypothetical protein
MTDRPILFSAPMVRALLAGTKTQTRRVLKFQPAPGISIIRKTIRPLDAEPYHSFERRSLYGNYAGELDVKIKRGDRLWVRETWSGHHMFRETPPSQRVSFSSPDGPYLREDVWLWADGEPTGGDYEKPRPGIHMPRWASRLTLTITEVRVEPLQDISEEDATAEGIVKVGRFFGLADADWDAASTESAVDSYAALWESINGAGSWDSNPWVAAYSFTANRSNIDQLAKEAA